MPALPAARTVIVLLPVLPEELLLELDDELLLELELPPDDELLDELELELLELEDEEELELLELEDEEELELLELDELELPLQTDTTPPLPDWLLQVLTPIQLWLFS
ncbi:hypothetical protein SAMN02745866_01363 [Alteromonadaceae bacterium Bs31]|nr:hypothetical protein SAMN02745866_01363 [Alteromonadaceae bacterium Bs31]